jgi:hypothetical protein
VTGVRRERGAAPQVPAPAYVISVTATRSVACVLEAIAATQIGDAMQSNKLVAWVEPRSRHEFVAAFVSAATASHRAPAVRQCSSPDEARHWVEREAAALGHVPVEWVSEPLSHR